MLLNPSDFRKEMNDKIEEEIKIRANIIIEQIDRIMKDSFKCKKDPSKVLSFKVGKTQVHIERPDFDVNLVYNEICKIFKDKGWDFSVLKANDRFNGFLISEIQESKKEVSKNE